MAQLFGRLFCVLEYFHHKLVNLMAPPTDGTAKCLVHCKAHLVLLTDGENKTFPILRQTASWISDYLAVKPSAIGQPTWPTQPSIPQGSVNE